MADMRHLLGRAKEEYLRRGFPFILQSGASCKGYDLVDRMCVVIENLQDFYGLKQKEIADFIEVYPRTLWVWEKSTPDKFPIPTKENQRRLLFLSRYMNVIGSPVYKLITGIKRPVFAGVIWGMLLQQQHDDVLVLTKELLSRSEDGCDISTKTLTRIYRSIAHRKKGELSEADNILTEASTICIADNVLSAVVSSEQGAVAFEEGLRCETTNPDNAARCFQQALAHINNAILTYPNEPEFFYNRLNAESKLRSKDGCIEAVGHFIRVAAQKTGGLNAKRFLLKRVNSDRDLLFAQRLEEIKSLTDTLGLTLV